MTSKILLEKIIEMVPYGSRVLDLGCGDGHLMNYLQNIHGCTGYGVEIDDENIAKCIQKRVQVIQLNLEQGLSLFEDQSFDVVLQIDTLQNLRNAETMLLETLRVGSMGIITFPNFGHWYNRWSVLNGHMPVTPQLPYEWYDTPNIRVGTFSDFKDLAKKNCLSIKQAFGIHNDRKIKVCPNLRAATAVFQLTSSMQ